MSSRAENWAWERDDVKGITKFVLVYLARRAYYDDGAAAWPSVKTIAFNCVLASWRPLCERCFSAV